MSLLRSLLPLLVACLTSSSFIEPDPAAFSSAPSKASCHSFYLSRKIFRMLLGRIPFWHSSFPACASRFAGTIPSLWHALVYVLLSKCVLYSHGSFSIFYTISSYHSGYFIPSSPDIGTALFACRHPFTYSHVPFDLKMCVLYCDMQRLCLKLHVASRSSLWPPRLSSWLPYWTYELVELSAQDAFYVFSIRRATIRGILVGLQASSSPSFPLLIVIHALSISLDSLGHDRIDNWLTSGARATLGDRFSVGSSPVGAILTYFRVNHSPLRSIDSSIELWYFTCRLKFNDLELLLPQIIYERMGRSVFLISTLHI